MTEVKPGQAIRLTVAGREVRIRDTFDLALRLEERFGSLFSLILRPRGEVPLADLFGILEEVLAGHDISREALKGHISAVGIGGAWRQISQIMNVLAEGWSALEAEATASAEANPPTPKRPRAPRKASLGPISSEPPASSASGPANSGGSRPSNSPQSGEPTPDETGLLAGLSGAAAG